MSRLDLAGAVPGAESWRLVLDRWLLGLSLLLLVAGAICLVAHHWSTIPSRGRLGLGQAVVLTVGALAAWLGPGSRYGKPLLTTAIGLIGPLLALFGQAYQTGADLSGLFVTWAALSLPWLLASRFAPAWLLWLAIVQAALGLHLFDFELWQTLWLGFLPTWLVACMVNLLILAAWETAAGSYDWLRGRLGPRVIAAGLILLLTVLTSASFWTVSLEGLALAPIAWLAVLAGGYWAYRVRRLDLVILALGWLSLTAVLLAGLIRAIQELPVAGVGYAIAAGALLALSALGRRWLQAVGAAGS